MEPLQQWWSRQTRGARLAVAGAAGAVVVLVVVVVAVLAGGGDEDDPGLVVRTGTASSEVPHASATAEPLPTQDPSLPTLESLRSFVEQVGDPPAANLGRFRIPRLGIDAPIGERVVGSDLNLQYLNPYGPADVSWYNFDVDPRYGGRIGEGRNAIFAAHVDYAALVPFAQVNYEGPGVFRDLGLLTGGDIIEVTMDGRTVRYRVMWHREVSESDGDWGSIFSADVPEGDAITLITCTGDFNQVTREYDSRTVVRAVRDTG